MSRVIRGWEELVKVTGIGDSVLRRAMALYEFPKPIKTREGSKSVNVWVYREVHMWLLQNKFHFVGNQGAITCSKAEQLGETSQPSDILLPPGNELPIGRKGRANHSDKKQDA
jgi:predicted DNA-binding transcriptional regulator AlpA